MPSKQPKKALTLPMRVRDIPVSTSRANSFEMTVTVVSTGLFGDVNGDGFVNITDVTALIEVISGRNPETVVCDLDANGIVNISDVTVLLNYLSTISDT